MLSGRSHGFYALLEREVLGRVLQVGDHWFCLSIKEAVAEKGSRSKGNFSCSVQGGSTDFKMQPLHCRVVRAMRLTKRLAMTTLKCQKDLTTTSSKERKEEGEVEASFEIKEARNLDPHIFEGE